MNKFRNFCGVKSTKQTILETSGNETIFVPQPSVITNSSDVQEDWLPYLAYA